MPFPDGLKCTAGFILIQEQIKSLLTGLMVSTPPLVRAQLSEGLSVISSYEFPAKWPTLLPELISRLEAGDAGTVHGVLETANSIYKRYRNQFMSTALSDELSYSQQFVQPLLKSLQVGFLLFWPCLPELSGMHYTLLNANVSALCVRNGCLHCRAFQRASRSPQVIWTSFGRHCPVLGWCYESSSPSTHLA
jgi:hypothetical protein